MILLTLTGRPSSGGSSNILPDSPVPDPAIGCSQKSISQVETETILPWRCGFVRPAASAIA